MSDSDLQQPGKAPPQEPDAALIRFADPATSPADRRTALSSLINVKFLPKNANHPSIAAGRSYWLSQTAEAAQPDQRLLAIAESIRLGQVVKRWADEIATQLRPAFEVKLPPLQLLGEADDRLNVARACAQMTAEWLPKYLARSIAEEEAGEKTRAELTAALFSRSKSLSTALTALVETFEALRPTTEAPGETVARRLTRTLSAVRELLLETDLEAGDGLGDALHALVSRPLATVGRPQEEKVQIDLSREVLLAVHDIVRSRISVVADPSMYRVVAYCRKLCGRATWPDELRKPLEKLTTDITEALVLLGRQGRADQGLIDQLHVLCNYPERAQALARELVAKHPELPEDVRDWLERGRRRVVRAASDAAIESAASNADESIGLSVQAARLLRALRDSLKEPLASSLEIYEPSLKGPVVDLLDRVQVLSVLVEQTAALRDVDLYGVPGEEVEMSAKYFDVVGDSPRQKMIVRQPAIVRKKADGGIGDVITKGLVE